MQGVETRIRAFSKNAECCIKPFGNRLEVSRSKIDFMSYSKNGLTLAEEAPNVIQNIKC